MSETGSPSAERHGRLDSLMPISAGASLAVEDDRFMLCGRWPVTLPRVFFLLRPSQSIDPNSQHSLLSVSDNDLLLRSPIESKYTKNNRPT